MPGFYTGGGGGATPADFWGYPTRTLTQSKFPFWSAIITQQAGSVTVPAGATVYVTIQPPAGETWLIDLLYSVDGANMFYIYSDFNGATARDHGYVSATIYTGATYLELTRILTNSLYARLGFMNTGTVSRTGVYGYSGFKLSKPLYSLARDISNPDPPRPWKKPATLPLPPIIAGLHPYAREFLEIDINRLNYYVLGILLEEDTPLAHDPDTGFPVERLTVVVPADTLADMIGKFKTGELDPVKTGYKKYLDKWKQEGIKLL
jgi:hypothetical protein